MNHFITRSFSLFSVLILCLGVSPQAKGDMTFSVNFTAQALADLDASEQALFINGVQFWDDIIIDHRDGGSRAWAITVDTFNEAASGGSIRLGSAGPSGLAFSGVVADSHTSNGRFIISTAGQAEFNIHPDAGALSFDTIKHEIGHALGMGTLWEDNEVYSDGVNGNSNRTLAGGTPGEYVGAFGLAAFQQEFVGQSGAAFIPVELAGGPGTAHGHWNESDDFGQTLTGLVTHSGQDMRDELMTGWASPNPDFFSNMSRESLRDIGFTVVPAAIPEPGSALALGMLAVGVLVRRRKRL